MSHLFESILCVHTATAEHLAVGEYGHCLTLLQVLELGPEHPPTGECVRTSCSR